MKTAILAAAAVATFGTGAFALDLVQWGTSGDWVIFTDPNHGNACLAQAELSDGSFLRFGFEEKGKIGFLATFNPAWKEFKVDRRYPVTYALDDEVFEGEARGKELAGMPGAQVRFENVDFMVGLAKRYKMTFSYEGAEIVTIDLKGSDKAMEQVLACQAEQS